MKIYLFRHAQKSTDLSGDPDLTAEGHNQASKLLDKVIKGELPQPTHLWVSPKKRTHSTFRPTATYFKIPLEIHEALTEQESQESLPDFKKRIQGMLNCAESQKNSVVFICSHYDWMVEAMPLIPSDEDLTASQFMHWSPCQFVGFNITPDGLYEFIELKRISL